MARRPRQRVARATRRRVDDAIATGAASGTHIFLRLPKLRADATERLLEAGRANGVHVYSARPYHQLAPRTATLILGYTTVALDEIEAGVQRLAAAYRKVTARSTK
jgi:GntR family transcriptional regulator/MocR family aminotransferase